MSNWFLCVFKTEDVRDLLDVDFCFRVFCSSGSVLLLSGIFQSLVLSSCWCNLFTALRSLVTNECECHPAIWVILSDPAGAGLVQVWGLGFSVLWSSVPFFLVESGSWNHLRLNVMNWLITAEMSLNRWSHRGARADVLDWAGLFPRTECPPSLRPVVHTGRITSVHLLC